MRTKFFASVAFAALTMPAAAFAQSTGSLDFEEGADIVVTGTADRDVGGIVIPDTPKSKVQVDRELLLRQTPGQSVNQIINLVPGVSFTNNDPFGSLGGSFTIRGFADDRISQTVDGIPLNDSGNYAIYTNQQQDPETLESVTVSLGSTDVDSPTASAVGGTINIQTRVPTDRPGALFSASYGDIIGRGVPNSRPFHRVFGMLDTGDLTGFGTKAWFSASYATNKSTFSNYGGVNKQQYNGRIYQDVGTNGDFISVSGHYNQNRNNFNGSPANQDNFAASPEARFYNVSGGFPCQTDEPQAGVRDFANTCGTAFERRFNPSNTGNIRGNSRFSLTDSLTLTIDPSFQYVKANGGGTVLGREGFRTIGGVNYSGFIGGQYYFGRDLNGDGDLLDGCSTTGGACSGSSAPTNTTRFAGVNLLSPSQTTTRRYVGIANLIWDVNDQNRVRLSYTYDRARHRQTGEVGFLFRNGEPFDVFPVNDPIVDGNGSVVQKRDRLSFAILHRIAAEYRGEFLDDRLIVNLGLGAPFFERQLDQRCFTTSAGGFIDCIPESQRAAYAAANPNFAPPQERQYNYDKLLPNVGFTYRFTPEASFYASYAKNISVPGTDTLYNSLFFDANSGLSQPDPELSDSFDAGFRYQSGMVQAQLGGFFTKYNNRLASAYDPDCDCNVQRNLGEVQKYGVDGSVSFTPIPEITAYVFGSYLKSEIQDDVLGGVCGTGTNAINDFGCTGTNGGTQFFFPTAGQFEAGSPEYTLGARLQGNLGPVELGGQIKRTGSRFLNDINTITLPGYTVVDLDLRYSLASAGLERSYFQLNVTNLFDEVYIGSASGGIITQSSFVNIGPPRAIIGSFVVGF
jgi:iron complex outermembrane recepter protein